MVIDKEDINYLQELFNDNRDLVVELYNYHYTTVVLDNYQSIIESENTQISFLEIPLLKSRTRRMYKLPIHVTEIDMSSYFIKVSYESKYHHRIDCFNIPVYKTHLLKWIREKRLSKLTNDR